MVFPKLRVPFLKGAIFALGIWGVLAPSTVHAQLTWEKRDLEILPSLDETNAVARFMFTNASQRTVTIQSVRTSCGCVTAPLEKMIYKPGEDGEIQANFNFGQRGGMQEKQILLLTDDPVESAVRLTMRVDIPELVQITPLYVFWLKGERAEPKQITVRVVPTEPARDVTLVGPTNSMAHPIVGEIRAAKPGREYVLEVKPLSADEATRVTLDLQVDHPQTKPRLFHVYAEVK